MNIDKYTQNAQGAIIDCQNIAIEEGNQQIDGEHLHLALLMQKDGLIPKLLKFMEVNTGEIIGALESEIDKLPKVSGSAESMYSTRRLQQLYSKDIILQRTGFLMHLIKCGGISGLRVRIRRKIMMR